jgi:hypothetical protein
MAYDTPQKVRYDLAGGVIVQFGAAGETIAYQFKGPPGKKGLVRDIEIQITETMVGTTTVPEIVVGATSSATEYARFRLGTSAISGYATSTAVRRARTLAAPNSTGKYTLTDFTGHVLLETDYIPADTIFFITLIEGVGGTPAGAGNVWVEVDWF